LLKGDQNEFFNFSDYSRALGYVTVGRVKCLAAISLKSSPTGDMSPNVESCFALLPDSATNNSVSAEPDTITRRH